MRYDGSVYAIKSNEVVAYTGTAGNSAAAATGIVAVRVVATTAAHVAIGKTVTATASDALLPANTPAFFKIFDGERVSVIQNAAGGNAYVTFLTQ